MITRLFVLLLTSWSAKSDEKVSPYITNIASKKNIHACTETIAFKSTNFTNLVKDSRAFIDNTMIIKELLEGEYEKTVLLCPSKWGRSTIMTMLKAFLEIVVDETGRKLPNKRKTANYALFAFGETKFNKLVQRLHAPLLISNEKDLMTAFAGEFPVIYVTFNDTTGENFTAVRDKIGIAVCQAFREHRYLGDVLFKENREHYLKFMNYLIYNESQIIEDGIPFLCNLLYKHFAKPVFILMDDYDKPLHNYLRVHEFEKKEFKRVLAFLEKIMEKAFEPKDEIRNGFVMGEFEPGRELNTTWKNYTKIYIGYDKTPLREFFGFNKKHVDYLYKYYRTPYKTSQVVNRWYGGHESMYSGEYFFTSYSIARYFQEKKLQPRLIEAGQPKDYIQRVIERDCSFSIRNTLLTLISKHQIQLFDERLEMSAYTLVCLKNLLINKVENNFDGEQFFYSYLFRKGYFTKIRDSEKTNEDEFITVKLVNHEAAYILAESIISYYVQDFNIERRQLRHAAIKLRDFIGNSDYSAARNLEEALTAIYSNTSAKIADEWLDPEQEDYMHSIFHSVVLQMQCTTKFEIEAFYNRTMEADIVVIDQASSQGFAIELSRQASADIAFASVQKYEHVFKNFVNIHKIQLAGINLAPNKTVQVLTKFSGTSIL